MKTHKVDVVSGHSYPQDNHALWFDESLNVLKKFDGANWVSGSTVSNGEKNFYTKEDVVPELIIWEGNAHSGDRIENFIQEPVAGESYTFELSDGRTFNAYWGDEEDFTIYYYTFGKHGETISVGYRLFGQDDYGWVFIYEGGNDANLVKISTEETTLNVRVWNYQDSLPIAMPKCINNGELGYFVAVFDNRPEEGRAYYIPEDDITFVPVLIGEYYKQQIPDPNSTEIPIECQWYYLSECSGEFTLYLNTIDNKYYAYIMISSSDPESQVPPIGN